MKRAGPLSRSSSLKRTAMQPGRKPLKKSRANPIPVGVREEVRARNEGRCEFPCPDPGAHLHHIRRRSQGGKHTPDNLAHLCAFHHSWVHDNPAQARVRGLLAQPGAIG